MDNSTARSSDQGARFCINVKFHIIRNTNGTNGFSGQPSTSPNYITSKLNENFNPHGIYLNNIGTNYINDSNLLAIDGTSEFDAMVNANNDPNAINYYIVNDIYGNIGGFVRRVGSNALVIRHHLIYDDNSSHEFGHALDLHHTFRGSYAYNGNIKGCPELLNGSNCRDCGDLVCDTPADANIETDDGYNPDLTNIMSYYYSKTNFTSGQGFRMR